MELLKAFLYELDWTRKKGVKTSGIYLNDKRWIFVSGDRAVDGEGKSVEGLQQFEQYRQSGPCILHASVISADQIVELGALLLGYNEPAKTIAVLSWCAGCFLKEHLKSRKIKYPHLFLIGEAGSGKSNTLERIILPIFSKTRITAASQVTKFTLMKEAVASNLIALLDNCAELWAFGDRISNGMRREIAYAESHGILVRYFSDTCKEVIKRGRASWSVSRKSH